MPTVARHFALSTSVVTGARGRLRRLWPPTKVGSSALVAGVVASVGLSTSPATAPASSVALSAPGRAPGTIFVANAGESGVGPGSITLYPPGATGDTRPEAVITKGLDGPFGLAFDASGDLWVSNNNTNTVVEYTKSELAKVSPVPSLTISWGASNRLGGLAGLAFDSSGNLWVDNTYSNNVIEYAKAELVASGSPAPRVTVTNASLFASAGPYGLAVDPAGDLWVEGSPSASADAVCEYPKAQLANPGPPAPRTTISPGFQLWDFTFDSSGNLWLPKYYLNAVAEYTKADLAKSGSPPARVTIIGSYRLVTPTDLAFDSSGDLWVLYNMSQALVEYSKGELAKSGAPTPVRTIEGANTGLDNPNYLAIEP